jgi:signal peptidase I
MENIFQKKFTKFFINSALYVLVVIWIGNYFFLIGLGVIYDLYISKKVNWTFWKKRDGINSPFIEWLDAIIYAVVVVTLINIFLFQNYKIPTESMEKSLLIGDRLLVSKLAYGPRMPNTPIAFPFVQHTIPLINSRSWTNLILLKYKRLVGFGKVKNNEPVVFNFPAGDTVVLENQAESYYEIVRITARSMKAKDISMKNTVKPMEIYLQLARKNVWDNSHVIYRPVDRRDNYVKRCVGIPGDTITIKSGDLYVNGKIIPENTTQQKNYLINTNGVSINPKAFERLKISRSDQSLISGNSYILPLTRSVANTISGFSNVTGVTPLIADKKEFSPDIFPYSAALGWNEDNYGPIWIPVKGSSVKLDTSNICLYNRIIEVYEKNDLKVEGSVIYINNKPVGSYTFKMDYYWMMGDNRNKSADSRYWGFVPEDHIIGKPKFIWFSTDKELSGLNKIRFGRIFKTAK